MWAYFQIYVLEWICILVQIAYKNSIDNMAIMAQKMALQTQVKAIKWANHVWITDA